ncbi:MAG: C97 family peptidase [archaeon]|nr:C97 family peptidase [archaeon]
MKFKYNERLYNLITHNCNHFSDEALVFLTGENVPEYIMKQEKYIQDTFLGGIFLKIYYKYYMGPKIDCLE